MISRLFHPMTLTLAILLLICIAAYWLTTGMLTILIWVGAVNVGLWVAFGSGRAR